MEGKRPIVISCLPLLTLWISPMTWGLLGTIDKWESVIGLIDWIDFIALTLSLTIGPLLLVR